MKLSATAVSLAFLCTSDAASFFKSPQTIKKYRVGIDYFPGPIFEKKGWFLSTNVRGGATGEKTEQ